MILSESLNQFKIPMLGKFLGGAMQSTKGSFIEGDVYVITAYNPHNDTVQTSGLTTRNRWVDAAAFEVVRNTSWSFKHGHVDLASDLAKFEDRGHDDHIEALSFSPFMHVDLSNSPDYSVTGRYIGNRWPELQTMPPARPLAADENQHIKDYEQYKACLPDTDFVALERRAAAAFSQSPRRETHRERFEREHLDTLVRGRHGKSTANYIFATGREDALRTSAKARRFAAMFNAGPAHNSLTDDIAEAMLACVRTMGVSPKLLGPNCRCAMPELKKGLHGGMILIDDPMNNSIEYASMLEGGKPTRTSTFVRDAINGDARWVDTLRKRLGDTVTARMAPISEGYNCSAECVRDVGVFVKGCIYRAIHTLGSVGLRVEHPHTSVPVPVDSRYFTRAAAIDDRDAPMSPTFDEQTKPDDSMKDESTFEHKLTTRKAQDTHVDTEGTADLRKYRYTPDTN